ncbi:MAG: hypothetical protein RIQ82_171 [Bacteroidota bacterium]
MLRYWSIFLLVFHAALWGQGNAPEPRGWSLDLDSPDYVHLSVLDMAHVISEDVVADRDKSMPWRYGIEREVAIDIFTHGQWSEFSDGTRIWRMEISDHGICNAKIVRWKNEFIGPSLIRI